MNFEIFFEKFDKNSTMYNLCNRFFGKFIGKNFFLYQIVIHCKNILKKRRRVKKGCLSCKKMKCYTGDILLQKCCENSNSHEVR